MCLRIALVDDHAVVRMGFRMLLESQPPDGRLPLRVVAEADDGETLLRGLSATPVDVVSWICPCRGWVDWKRCVACGRVIRPLPC